MKKDHRGINPASKPSGDGCVECLASPKGWWFGVSNVASGPLLTRFFEDRRHKDTTHYIV